MFASKATRTGVQLPSPPVYARSGSGERRLSHRNCSEGGPVSPCHINAASFDSASQSHRTLAAVAESEGCHAVALRRRTLQQHFRLPQRLRLGKPANAPLLLCLY